MKLRGPHEAALPLTLGHLVCVGDARLADEGQSRGSRLEEI